MKPLRVRSTLRIMALKPAGFTAVAGRLRTVPSGGQRECGWIVIVAYRIRTTEAIVPGGFHVTDNRTKQICGTARSSDPGAAAVGAARRADRALELRRLRQLRQLLLHTKLHALRSLLRTGRRQFQWQWLHLDRADEHRQERFCALPGQPEGLPFDRSRRLRGTGAH